MSEALPEAAAEGSEHMTVATAHVASMSSGKHATPTIVVLDKTAHAQRSVMVTTALSTFAALLIAKQLACLRTVNGASAGDQEPRRATPQHLLDPAPRSHPCDAVSPLSPHMATTPSQLTRLCQH